MNQPEEFLRACIHDILPISSSANAAIRQITDYVQLAKNEVFISSERANAYEYFLLQGICRSYLIDPVGDDITISFFQGPSVLSPHSIRTANRLSLYNFQACTDILLGRIDAGEATLLLDLAQLDYISSAGLRSLLIAAKRAQSAEGRLAVCALTTNVREVFRISGFDTIIDVHPDRDAALRSFA